MNKTEFALESFKNTQDLIKFIDQKSGAILVIAGLVFTAFLQTSNNLRLVSEKPITFVETLIFLTGLVTVVNLLIVIYISIYKILKPRLAQGYKKDEVSLLYFEHLSALSKEEIYSQYEDLDESKILKYITDQQHEISRILELKTIALNKAFDFLSLSIFSLIIFMISSGQI